MYAYNNFTCLYKIEDLTCRRQKHSNRPPYFLSLQIEKPPSPTVPEIIPSKVDNKQSAPYVPDPMRMPHISSLDSLFDKDGGSGFGGGGMGGLLGLRGGVPKMPSFRVRFLEFLLLADCLSHRHKLSYSFFFPSLYLEIFNGGIRPCSEIFDHYTFRYGIFLKNILIA